MSIASLNRFTVPLATDQSASTQGLLMPRLTFRFRVTFENFGVSTNRVELTKQVMNIDRPSVSFGVIDVHVYNSKVKLAGKPEWQDISCQIRDDAAGNVIKLVGEQTQKQFDFMEQSSAASGVDYKFTMKIESLDGGNGAHEVTVLDTWELYGCWIDPTYSKYDYSQNGHCDISLKIHYDNAVQTPLGTGIGTDVGRTIGSLVTG